MYAEVSMTIGIYVLHFNGTDKKYVGQSINIEARYYKHLSMLQHNKASPKLQEAYNVYGNPSLEIVLECSQSELDICEKEAISIYGATYNGLNTEIGGAYHSSIGEVHPTAKYSNEQYAEVLAGLLNPSFKMTDIAKATGVSYNVVVQIYHGESHGYLEEIFPDNYAKLKLMRSTNIRRPVGIGILISPEGVEHTVLNISSFAKEHGLSQSHLSNVINGKARSHKGWKRA